MKKVILILVVLCSTQIHAQYFQSLFGGTSPENNAKVIPSNDAAGGYVLVGNVTPAATIPQSVYAIRSDNNGATPAAPFFNNLYTLVDPITFLPYATTTHSVTEYNPAPGVYEYIVSGVIVYNAATNDYDVYLMKLDALGNMLWCFRYDMPNFGFKEPRVQMDIAGTNVLVTGRCANYGAPAQLQDVYAMSVNAGTGVLNWFQTYDMIMMGVSQDDFGTDIIDNPYTAGQCLIVGNSGTDALLLTINSVNGLPIGASTYNIGAMGHQFTSIRTSTNPLIANAFCVSGNVTLPVFMAPAQQDAWTLLIDQAGAVAWSTTHDNSFVPQLNNTAMEIIERFNPFTGLHEYYTAGSIVFGGPNVDIDVLKLNNNGFLMPGGEFTYGVAAQNEQGNSICMSNTGGFTVSATNNVNAGDQMLVNAYFNGVTACNYATNTFTSTSTLTAINTPTVNVISIPFTNQVISVVGTLPQNYICFAPMVMGGSNLREAPVTKGPAKDAGFNFNVIGNGQDGNAGDGTILLDVNNTPNHALTARLIDVTGREYPCTLTQDNAQRIRLNTHLPAAGMYYITLTSGSESKTRIFLNK